MAVESLGTMPSLADIDPEAIGYYIGHDKKRSADGISWVLPTDNGIALNQRVASEEALEVFRELKKPPIWRD